MPCVCWAARLRLPRCIPVRPQYLNSVQADVVLKDITVLVSECHLPCTRDGRYVARRPVWIVHAAGRTQMYSWLQRRRLATNAARAATDCLIQIYTTHVGPWAHIRTTNSPAMSLPGACRY